ncbi:MAG: response regulator [Lachnospiraceae bacterium]|nr:response regulator [Lachnospiraceae bacterium]
MSGNVSDKKYETFNIIVKTIFFITLGVVFLGMMVFFKYDHSDPIDSSDPFFIEDWTITAPNGDTTKAGSTYRNDPPQKGIFTMETTLPYTVTDGSNFCFIIGGNVEIYINGELRDSFDQDRDFSVPGGVVKRYYKIVPLSAEDAGKDIKIIRKGTSRRGFLYQDTFVATYEEFFTLMMERYALPFMLGEILFIFSTVIVIISIALTVIYKQRIEMLYGAMSIAIISAWLITNSYLFPFVYGHYHIDGIVNYLLCLMMPFNLVFYLDALQHGRYRKIMKVVQIVSLINLFTWSVLHFTKTFSFASALLYIDIVLGLQVLTVMGILAYEVIKGGVKEYRYTAIGFAGFLICCLAEITILNFTPIFHDDVPMLVGLAFLLVLAVIQQIDDLRKIRDERQKAIDLSEAKTKFLASMSHEIRTPINAVLGMNEMILRENKDPNIADYAESVKSSGKMLLMLVNDVLDFSKIEAGKMEITMSKYRLSYLIRDIMPILKERADEKKLELITDIKGGIPDEQISDEFRIRQILINIISNAIKYTDEGSVTLTIGGSYLEDGRFMLNMSIKDTGRGIKEEDQEHLFEAFQRADVGKNRNIEGTGLGLAIVKSIVDSMHGDIRVKSVYGEGSEFIIDLPVEASSKSLLTDVSEDEDENNKADECDFTAPDAAILAVDDNGINLKIVKSFLKRTGIVPDICDNGRRAVDLCKEKKYDILLLDHMMPEPDGLETLNLIRTLPDSKNKDTVAIVLTANALSDSRKTYLEAGFADYLTKPLDSNLLEQTIRKYLPEDKVISK